MHHLTSTVGKQFTSDKLPYDFSTMVMLSAISAESRQLISKDALYKEKQDYFESIIKNRQFELFGQHQKNMDLGLYLGTEVLLRVPNPSDLNTYLPTEYWIGFAEYTDKIGELSLEILAQLIENADMLSINCAPYYVNIPPPLISVELVHYVKDLLEKAGLPYNFIGIELTERQPIVDHVAFRQGIDAFQHLGISIALDDYGRGYATMQVLSDTPVDRVKIDQGLLLQAKVNKSRRLVLESLLDFASSFDIEVIAEGVENEDDYIFVQKLGCDGLQGFYIDMPHLLIPMGKSRT